MMKKLLVFVLTSAMLFNICGCARNYEGAIYYHRVMDYFFKYDQRVIFPPTLDNVQEVVEFHEYLYDREYLGSEYYLSAIYDEENFEIELNRLASLSSRGRYDPIPVFVDTIHFNYPAFLTRYRNPYTHENEKYKHRAFEYALIDYEKRNVIYVYLYDVLYEDVSFDKKYLPKDYLSKEDDFYFDIYFMDMEEYNEFISSQSSN